MKNFLSLTLILTCFVMSYAQNTTYEYVPGVIGYEAIAYNSNGEPLVEQQITLRASILRSSTTGLVEYQEIHSVTTRDDGYFMIMIGDGTWTAGEHSAIDAIPWGEYEFILKMEMDAAGGYNFGDVAADQFCSVPYSFRAAVSDSLSGVDKALLISTINGSGTCPCTLQDAYDNGNTVQINATATHIRPVWITNNITNTSLLNAANFISHSTGTSVPGIFRYDNINGSAPSLWSMHSGFGVGNIFLSNPGSGSTIYILNDGVQHGLHSISGGLQTVHGVLGEANGTGNAGRFILRNPNSNEAVCQQLYLY
jgi:hypothetical protein